MPASIELLREGVGGSRKTLEVFLNNHGVLTGDAQQFNALRPSIISEIEYSRWAYARGVRDFFAEGLSIGKTPSDSIPNPVGGQGSTMVPDEVLGRFPLVQKIRNTSSQQDRYRIVLDNLDTLMRLQTSGSYIAREVIGVQNIRFSGAEDYDAQMRMTALSFELGFERTENSFLDTAMKLDGSILPDGSLPPQIRRNLPAIKQYMEQGVGLLQEYFDLHKLRGKTLVEAAVYGLSRSSEAVGVLFVGAAHYGEVLDSLERSGQRYRIYAPVGLNARPVPVEEIYAPVIAAVSGLKKHLDGFR